MNPALAQWINQHKANPQHQRLGQAFCNTFIKGQYPELFYCEDQGKAITMIEEYLNRYHYFDVLPAPVRAINQIVHNGTATFRFLLNKRFPYQKR